ncbi:MAG: hypothetical protein ABC559_01810 [Candidatus Methanosuratincola petrocarbonis]
MAVNENVARLLNRVRAERKAFSWKDENGEVQELEWARLDLNDNIALDEKTGRNIFAEMAEASANPERTSLFKTFSYSLQREIAFCSLKKVYPDLTLEEAGTLASSMPPEKFWEALTWAISGGGAAGPPTRPSRGGLTTRRSDSTSGSRSS